MGFVEGGTCVWVKPVNTGIKWCLFGIYLLYIIYGVLSMTEPKTKMFTAKVDEDLLKAFKHACQNQDTTASQAVRAFMREYVRKHGQADLFK